MSISFTVYANMKELRFEAMNDEWRVSDVDELRIGNELVERYGYLDANSASSLGPLQDYVS